MSFEKYLENLVLAVAVRVVESYIGVAGQVVKGYGYDPVKVDKVCEDMLSRAKIAIRQPEAPVPVRQGEGGKGAGAVGVSSVPYMDTGVHVRQGKGGKNRKKCKKY
jgi:hypothetical protein